MSSIATSLLLVVAFIAVSWVALAAFGVELALLPSLLLSVGLTLILNVAFRAFSRRRKR